MSELLLPVTCFGISLIWNIWVNPYLFPIRNTSISEEYDVRAFSSQGNPMYILVECPSSDILVVYFNQWRVGRG